MHVSYESLEAKFPNEGRSRYNAIAKIVGAEQITGPFPRHDGGIDLTGVFEEGTVYTKEQQAEVKRLAETATTKAVAAAAADPIKKDGDK